MKKITKLIKFSLQTDAIKIARVHSKEEASVLHAVNLSNFPICSFESSAEVDTLRNSPGLCTHALIIFDDRVPRTIHFANSKSRAARSGSAKIDSLHPLKCFQESRCGFVVSLMALYWMTETLPLAITALLPVVLFPSLGIISSDETCQQYLVSIPNERLVDIVLGNDSRQR